MVNKSEKTVSEDQYVVRKIFTFFMEINQIKSV